MSECKIRFGTAGTSDSFTAMGYKNSLDIPAYTEKMGLDAFEYQCGHGVRLGLDKARQMADDAAARGILFSVHAPYYISASSLDEEKRLNSVNYLLQSAALCRALGGRRVIFHSGSCGRQSREAALEKALDTLKRAQDALDEAGFAEIILCLRRWERSASWARWRRCWPSAGWTDASPPASTSATSTPGRWAASAPRRIMPLSLTASGRRWGMRGPGSSMSTFPASSIPRAVKSGTGPLPRPSSAPNPSP